MRWLVIGRTASGKDTLASLAEAFGLRVALSTTTRAPRGPGDRHRFVSDAGVAPASERLAATEVAGSLYYLDRDEVAASDVVVVDPAGVRDVAHAFPDDAFACVIVCASAATRQARYEARGTGGIPFAERERAEAKRFGHQMSDLAETFPDNVVATYYVKNDDAGGLDRLTDFAQFMQRSVVGVAALEAEEATCPLVDADGKSLACVLASVYLSDHQLAEYARTRLFLAADGSK